MMNDLTAIGCFTAVIAFVIGICVFMGWLTMTIWNAVLVPMGAPEINFWIAFGLYIVLSAIFGGSKK